MFAAVRKPLVSNLFLATLGLMAAGVSSHCAAQVSLTTLGTPATQNFDTLINTGSATWTNNTTLPGWYHARTGTGTTIVANDGSSNAGNLYSYGTGTATDRALGSLGSGNAAIGNLFWGVRLQNNTGSTITQLDVSYIGEQWRNSAAAAQTVAFSYLVGSPTVTGSLAEFQSAGIAVASLDFAGPITGGVAGALNGNLAANRVSKTFSITGLSIPNGTEVMLRWSDPDHTGADHGLGIDDFSVTPQGAVTTAIHDVQGNGASTPIPGSTVSVEGVVIANFQGANRLQGFYLQEEDTDADADPNTSEGIFVFCNTCPTPVAEGQRVRATGTVSELNALTQISAGTAGAVVVTNAGNNLAQVTPSPIDLPVAGVIDDFYEARESMLVAYVDTLSVSEYFELPRYGQIVLFEGGRPLQFTETAPPNVAGYAAHLNALSRRQVILDDDNNTQQAYLASPDGSQRIFHPQANGGFSVGTQGTDYFRGGDLVNGLTGVLDWSSPGFGAATWRIRPAAAHPVTFTVANPRPATPPAVGGAIKVAGVDLFNYFTTIDTTASTTTGPCGPAGTQDCRGADSTAELIRQRDRASIVACTVNADIVAFTELENTTPSATITDLLGAINARCGGAHPYTFVNTGGTLGSDAVRVEQIYRTGIVSPVGSPLVDLDPIHDHPPTAQTFDVVDATNPAFGQRFSVVASDFKSKGCAGATGADVDAGDGQACYADRRTQQANRLLSWINSTVLPAAGDPDVLLLGNFNAFAQETPISTLTGGGFTDLAASFLGGGNAYAYVLAGELGHLDYALSSGSLTPQATGAGVWHINADEASLFDYNDEILDSPGEAAFEEKPDGSALVPPRVVFQPASPYRASDRDLVVLGLFQVADVAITKVDTPDPVTAGNTLTYTITVTNNGPDSASNASWSDTLPAGTTFVSLPAVAGWSCTTGATVSCSNASFAAGSAVFTLTVAVDPSVANGATFSNTATITSSTADPNTGNNSATATTTVGASADLGVTNVASTGTAIANDPIAYTITVQNNGPSTAASVTLTDAIPANTTFTSLSSPGGWSCTTPAVGGTGVVTCSSASLAVGAPAVFILTVTVSAGPPTTIVDTATIASSTTDPNSANNSATASTTTPVGLLHFEVD